MAEASMYAMSIVESLPEICQNDDLDLGLLGMMLCGFLGYKLCGEPDSMYTEEIFFKNMHAAIEAGRANHRSVPTTSRPQ